MQVTFTIPSCTALTLSEAIGRPGWAAAGGNTAKGVSVSATEREWQKGWQTRTEVLFRRDIANRLGEGW